MLEGVDAGIVTVAPIDLDSIVPHLFDVQHLERGREHLERSALRLRIIALLWLRSMRAGASGTGAFIAQVAELVGTVIPIRPILLDRLRFCHRYVFRLGFTFDQA